MGATVERAAQLVAQLTAAGVKATADVGQVAGNAPIVLVTPPVRDLAGGPTRTWTLAALDAQAVGSLAAWSRLDDLVDQAVAALDGLVEQARPSSYAHTPGTDPLPAYLLTFTESE